MKNLILLIENFDTDKAIGKLLGLAPWLTPLSTMQITITNMITRLGFWPPVAWATGLSIEILGMATLHTALAYYQHNRRYSDVKNKMPLFVPVLAFCLYLVLVIAIVIALELPLADEAVKAWINLAVKGLLALLSIPAGLVIVARELQRETVEKLARKPKQAAQNEPPKKETSEQVAESPAQVAEDKTSPAQVSEDIEQVAESPAPIYESWKQVPEEVRKRIATFTHWTQVQEAFPYVKERSCQDWLRYAHTRYAQS